MSHVPRFSFGAPSTGDKLLRASNSLKIHLSRWPGDEPEAECAFEIRGELKLDAAAAGELLDDLLREYSQPVSRDGRDAAGGAA